MRSFFERRRFEARLRELAQTLCPSTEEVVVDLHSSGFADFPKARLEYAMAELFASCKAVAAGVQDERVKVRILALIRDCFLARFKKLAQPLRINGNALREMTALRLTTYDSLLREPIEENKHVFVEALWLNVTGHQLNDPTAYLHAAAIFDNFVRTRKLLDDVKGFLVVPDGMRL